MRALTPQITKIADRKVITVTSIGDPNTVMELCMKALYGAAYFAKMKVYKPKGIKMELGKLVAQWPDAHLKPKDQWTGVWGVPVPNYVTEKDKVVVTVAEVAEGCIVLPIIERSFNILRQYLTTVFIR